MFEKNAVIKNNPDILKKIKDSFSSLDNCAATDGLADRCADSCTDGSVYAACCVTQACGPKPDVSVLPESFVPESFAFSSGNVLSAPHVLCKKSNLEERISNIFITLGIPPNIIGFHYLREAVKIAAGDYSLVCSITKKLYPQVAARFNSDACKVERGIRHAIEVAWNKGKIININSIFGLPVFDSNEKPTNSQLIAILADKMILED